MIEIRLFSERDWDATWQILEPVFRSGGTYPYAPSISSEDARKVWIEAPTATYVATNQSGNVLGTYYLKPNQPALGAHVCNCGYAVNEGARGQGIASMMCEHSQSEAVSRGFTAMQYNLVVSTNERAVRLWKKHGFNVVGTLPHAFHHQKLGLVDALVMYKRLVPEE